MMVMKTSTYVGHAITLCVVGVILGFAFGSIKEESDVSAINKTNTTNMQQCQASLQQAQESANLYQRLLQVGRDRPATETILMEPGAPPRLDLFGGAIGIVPNGVQGAVGPRWAIPAKIVPRSIGGSQGLSYVYWDGTQYDSPHMVQEIRPGERYGANGWIPQ